MNNELDSNTRKLFRIRYHKDNVSNFMDGIYVGLIIGSVTGFIVGFLLGLN